MEASLRVKKYFAEVKKKTEEAYNAAFLARGDINVSLTHTLAERVVGLLSSLYPEIKNTTIVERIFTLEKKYGFLDWRVAFVIAKEVAEQKFLSFSSDAEAILCGVRVGFAYITTGTVSSPLEGLIHIDLVEQQNDKPHLRLVYGGPIRNAGGTAASVSVLIADYVRISLGYGKYHPDKEEISRIVVEVYDYNKKVTNLQYLPAKEELDFFVSHIPVEIAGEPTEKHEVSAHRNLKRVSTNRIRSGVCLVYAECLCLKAPKLLKNIKSFSDFDFSSWNFLGDFCKRQKQLRSHNQNTEKKIGPDFSYIADITMGRPVFGFPSTPGGFRLRYGRSRYTGFSAMGVHPAVGVVTDGFIAPGTQLRVERPGKSTIALPCEGVFGPIVKLKNNSVIRIHSYEQGCSLSHDIEEVLFLGDILINYGDFLDRGHALMPAGYCPEWWYEDFCFALKKSNINKRNIEAQKDFLKVSSSFLEQLHNNIVSHQITPEIAFRLSEKLHIPLHPIYTPFWSLLKKEEFSLFLSLLEKAKIRNEEYIFSMEIKPLFEKIGLEHRVEDKSVVLSVDNTKIMLLLFVKKKYIEKKTVLESLNTNSSIVVRDTAGSFIGARMGRPEKAKMRRKSGATHGLAKESPQEVALSSFLQIIPEEKRVHNIKFGEGGENWKKAALRAQGDLFVYKDGTLRYDATEAPVTHIKACEIGVSYRDLKKLGYKKDVYGKDLVSDNQIVELLPQDVILPCCKESSEESCDSFLLKTAEFVDLELKYVYNKEFFYHLKKQKDLLGHLVVGLAPHTSAGCVMRIIGFSNTQTMLCHPYMHSMMRRDCDGDESCFILLMDALLNFEPSFLPKTRGSKMDAPFVITPLLEPKEVDDMVFKMDIVASYPKEFYEGTLIYKNPWDINILTIKDVLETPKQFEGTMFTHETGNINKTTPVSKYKQLDSMKDLVFAQMNLSKKIRGVDAGVVAGMVLEKHIMKDISKNLDKYFIQEYRCVKCNKRLRRPSLSAICLRCGGNLMPTLSLASVLKYRELFNELRSSFVLPPRVKKKTDLFALRLARLFD